MNFSSIDQNVAKHIALNQEEIDFFHGLLQHKKVKRKQMILQEGDFCKDSFFVVEGCLRSFSIDKNGFEHILNFAPPNWWISDLYSLFSQKPCILNIESIENSQIILFSRENQEKLFAEIPKFERFFRIIAEKSLVSHQQRLLDNLSLTAEERYENFCKRYPSLIDGLAQKYIAAYIGVTPEFFSKMRSKILRNS
ncbi:MAG: Crp/Fnr family transcriptional regulator [Bacteroidetes bacterium]|nr:MAG: Crp/Fnr family transcriptional regulator [Bacteroidota bacterium]